MKGTNWYINSVNFCRINYLSYIYYQHIFFCKFESKILNTSISIIKLVLTLLNMHAYVSVCIYLTDYLDSEKETIYPRGKICLGIEFKPWVFHIAV